MGLTLQLNNGYEIVLYKPSKGKVIYDYITNEKTFRNLTSEQLYELLYYDNLLERTMTLIDKYLLIIM